MTDEEKADEYANNLIHNEKYGKIGERRRLRKAYLDGLAEGRVSTTEKYSQVDRATISSVETLEKENAELKEQIEKLKFLLDVDNNELIKENLGLKAQIEDMKSCNKEKKK